MDIPILTVIWLDIYFSTFFYIVNFFVENIAYSLDFYLVLFNNCL
jgi:hypothetical protein